MPITPPSQTVTDHLASYLFTSEELEARLRRFTGGRKAFELVWGKEQKRSRIEALRFKEACEGFRAQ